MEYVYSAMLLHSAKKGITEDAVAKVLKAAGIESDASRVKALIASLKEVNIDEAIEKAAVAQAVQVQPAAHAGGKAEAKKEEVKEEQGKTEEEAAEGLGSLFG
ncbi:MAG: 50S ribosomal protein P1 [Candidatus Diapherotrites archaeon]|uniref:Large ribosomal subunit protein P1 n=1 Tax=Candidatus Iainarchaeum sp. TaxID=3101447 RepID=A0A7J4ITA9_9ARCH|nr:MAG: 50S ribosomal protein L12P, large subunit ribosomal protein L12 [archaeon GW2011_AR10]MBS3059057.1 50S ribosomal protein P1 [Candidatus Diapherotrites archaeon]HIH08753.1 50S ribosomal protein P1 [Candidatus Diapherotrites archaeon]